MRFKMLVIFLKKILRNAFKVTKIAKKMKIRRTTIMTIVFVILIFASAVVAVYVANRHAAKACKAEKEQVSLFINSKNINHGI